MFDNKTEPEDMFSQTDTGPAPAASPSSAASSPASSSPTPTSALSSFEPPTPGGRFPWKVIIVILAVVFVIGVAAFLSYYLLSGRTGDVTEVPAASDVTPVEGETPHEAEEPARRSEAPTPTPTATVEPDSDQDGLSDAQEAEIGTSVSKPDTDSDGLFDREEVEVYQTNPLNPDTDGDTYSDGTEVSGGYNPNGSGKLFSIPSHE